MAQPFDTIEEALADIAAGKLVIVTDDENRENEGDLVMAASKVTPETVNMMIRHARGLICVPTVEHQLRRLGISQMVPENRESQRTAFAVSVDASEGISTGISAYDRAKTIAILSDPRATRAARPHLSAHGQTWRSIATRRTHGGSRRPRLTGRPAPKWGDLRNLKRRWFDGPPARINRAQAAV